MEKIDFYDAKEATERDLQKDYRNLSPFNFNLPFSTEKTA